LAEIPAQATQQHVVSALPERLWDVVIVGAGPAGSVAAFYLARDGHSVLLIDKEHFPREKVCGDFLFTDIIKFLRKTNFLDAIREVAHEVRSLVAYSPSGICLNVPGEYLTLKRASFDQLLVRRAVDTGASFIQGKVINVQIVSDSKVIVSLAGLPIAIQTQICVLATGANVSLANRLGLISRKEPSAVAARCYVRSKLDLDQVILSYDRSLIPGYGWIVPLGHNEFNVGCGIRYDCLIRRKHNIKKAFTNFLTAFPPARLLMESGEVISPFQGAALRCSLAGARSVLKDRVVMAGEAIGTTLPFTGEGVGTAIESGEIVAAVISEALRNRDITRLQKIPLRLIAEMKPKYKGYKLAEKWMSHRWLNDLVAWRISKSSFLYSQIQDFISGNSNARTVYAPFRILQSFWK